MKIDRGKDVMYEKEKKEEEDGQSTHPTRTETDSA
jgi:hypothetical protein